MPEITSRRNPQVRLARALRRAKERRESGLFLVEGLRNIGELLESGFQIEFVLYAPGELSGEFGTGLVEAVERAGIPLHAAGAGILSELSEKGSSGGMIAVARRTAHTLDSLSPPESGWSVALLEPRDPGNVGTILRTMDAFQVGSLFLLDGGADPWQPGAVRASMGALFTHPVVEAAYTDFIEWTRGLGLPVCGTSAHAAEDITALSAVSTPAILLFGSERDGLSPAQQAACSAVYRIPMQGRGTSLNLAVAAGIALYTASNPV